MSISIREDDVNVIDKVNGVTLEEAYQKVGGWGRFQTFMLISMILAMNSAGLVELGIVYLELDPKMLCTFTDDPTATPVPCIRDQVCSTGDYATSSNPVLSWEVDYSSRETLNNWIVQLDMYCTPKEYIGFIGAMAFAGAAIACFFLPILGDKYGRWIIFEITMGIQIPLYLMALTTRSLWVIYFLCFYLGVTLIGRFTCGFVLLTELVPERY